MIILGNGDTIITSNGKNWNGIIFSKKYELLYKLNDFTKTPKLRFKGLGLIKGFTSFRKFALSELDAKDDMDLFEKAKQIVVAWGTLSITNEIEYQNYIEKFSGAHVVPLMNNFISGDNKYKEFFRDAIATYIVLSKMRYDAENVRNNRLTLHDLHWDFMDESVKKSAIANWRDHNITKRNGIKSCEEFIELLKSGCIHPDWSKARISCI